MGLGAGVAGVGDDAVEGFGAGFVDCGVDKAGDDDVVGVVVFEASDEE